MSPEGKRVIHYTELVDPPADWVLFPEWKTFRAALPGLLAEGHDGKFALVKGDQIIGVFATLDEGVRAGRERYLMQPFMVQPIRTWEPMLRLSPYCLPPCRT